LKTTSLDRLALNGGLIIAFVAIMPHARERSKQKRVTSARLPLVFSAKRNGEAWIDISASLRAQRLVRRSLGEGGSNPESHRGKTLDCLVASPVAMTECEEMSSRLTKLGVKA
jgi:hypothetical protein